MKKFILLLGLSILTFYLIAETLIGRIKSTEDKDFLEDVTIQVMDSNKGTFSDEKGNFAIKNLTPGSYVIQFSKMGYESFQVKVDFPEENKLQIKLKRKPIMIEGMRVSSTIAVDRETPVTFTNMDKKNIDETNYGQDIPMLLNELPNVFSYSDAGSPMGYSYLKIRGFDQKRIGVMINGIPLNDPEDHQVYWVDMPDFAESISNIQFQRGVGSSIYGVSTFGGSLNMQTNNATNKQGFDLFANYGSFNTYKYGFKTTYNVKKKCKLNLRFSHITSDGYRDNSATEQYSYFVGVSEIGERSITEFNFYGGKEITHAAWYASWEGDLEKNHNHNPITYDNEIDNFNQPHFELHHSYRFNERIGVENSLFYIRGKGFYEQYKEDRDLWEYGLVEEPELIETDLIRQKWVKKNQYGWVGNLDWKHPLGKLTLGTYISLFDSEHFGEVEDVIGADSLGIVYNKNQEYHNYTGNKKYYTFYINEIFKKFGTVSIMVNLHYQIIDYQFKQHESGNFTGENLHSYQVDYNFFNPRFGINYNLSKAINIYGNLSFAHREPTDGELFDIWDGPDDLGVSPLFADADTIYVDGQIDHIEWSEPYVKEEKLMDVELGIGYAHANWKIKTNLFWMKFQNEIIGYGTVDDDGNPIRGNADETVHQGIEVTTEAEFPANLYWNASFSYNDNYFEKFIMKDWNGDIDLSGKKIGGFPDILASSKLSWKWKTFLSSLQIQHVGKQYLDNTENEDRIVKAYQLLNLGFGYTFKNLIKKAEIVVNVKVNNLLDTEYETSGYYDPWGGTDWSGANYYFPGSGRNIIAGFRVNF